MLLPLSQRFDSLTQLSEIEYILQAMRNLPMQIIEGRSARSLHSPVSKKSSFMMVGEVNSDLERAPILLHESRNTAIKHS